MRETRCRGDAQARPGGHAARLWSGRPGIDHQRGRPRSLPPDGIGRSARQRGVSLRVAGLVDRQNQLQTPSASRMPASLANPCALVISAAAPEFFEPIRERPRRRTASPAAMRRRRACRSRYGRQRPPAPAAAGWRRGRRVDTAAGERIGEPVRGCPQGTYSDLFDDACFGIETRGAARLDLRPAVATSWSRWHLPAERTVERVVAARGGQDVGRVHRGAGYSVFQQSDIRPGKRLRVVHPVSQLVSGRF